MSLKSHRFFQKSLGTLFIILIIVAVLLLINIYNSSRHKAQIDANNQYTNKISDINSQEPSKEAAVNHDINTFPEELQAKKFLYEYLNLIIQKNLSDSLSYVDSDYFKTFGITKESYLAKNSFETFRSFEVITLKKGSTGWVFRVKASNDAPMDEEDVTGEPYIERYYTVTQESGSPGKFKLIPEGIINAYNSSISCGDTKIAAVINKYYEMTDGVFIDISLTNKTNQPIEINKSFYPFYIKDKISNFSYEGNPLIYTDNDYILPSNKRIDLRVMIDKAPELYNLFLSDNSNNFYKIYSK